MSRTLMYLFPKASKASRLKIFQERTSQIRAFRFTKESIKEVEGMEFATNYAVYFLFDESNKGIENVYIGQSTNGISRIKNHVLSKDFWSYCIMFVTDNNSFDKSSIDYMEYAFIKMLKQSSYMLVNKELRENEPIISQFDKPSVLSYIEQIKFLLSAEGVDLKEVVIKKEQETIFDVVADKQIFRPKSNQYEASVYIESGQFVLMKGSKIVRPRESTKKYDNHNLYSKNNSVIDRLEEDNKIVRSDDSYVLLVDLSFKSPSAIAQLVTGRSSNG